MIEDNEQDWNPKQSTHNPNLHTHQCHYCGLPYDCYMTEIVCYADAHEYPFCCGRCDSLTPGIDI